MQRVKDLVTDNVAGKSILTESLINPYQPPTIDVATLRAKGLNTHHYAGRTIYVTAGFLPSRLWMVGGFVVTTDSGERFASASSTYDEDFRWQFEDKGHIVECRLRTHRKAYSHFRMPYELIIGDQRSKHLIAVSGAWFSLMVIPASMIMLPIVPYLLFRLALLLRFL